MKTFHDNLYLLFYIQKNYNKYVFEILKYTFSSRVHRRPILNYLNINTKFRIKYGYVINILYRFFELVLNRLYTYIYVISFCVLIGTRKSYWLNW